MKVLLDIKDAEAPFVMEVLKSLSFVKIKQLTPANARFLEELKDVVNELNEVKKGKKKGRKVEAFLHKLTEY